MIKPDTTHLTWLQMLGILLAATVLGLSYNQASPLGVRAAKSAGIAPKRTGFSNETVSLTVDAAESPPTPATPKPVRDIPNLTWAQVKPLLAATPRRTLEGGLGKTHFVARQLAEMDRNGTLATVVAPIANWGSDVKNTTTRKLAESVAGIDARAE